MASEISEIKQESPMDDVRSSNTSLISSANVTVKNCSNINKSAKHNEEPRQGVARKRSLIETGEEENGRSIDLNVELTPTDSSGEEVEFSNATSEEPPLVAMGCTRCLVFVLTSETNPKCVNCQTPDHLIDVLHYNPPKKPKHV
ncbi:hypothetical protein GOBAR_AA17860 [Gossypium barbadense]|uniref:GIR1-like zinc ribbon domain-containing protein n=1 Tax=Gossypium barbadense TaxID=3634 RepID=A0A2P5XHH8_GOSBA|nr:hypothetical protein GOBAR_AA17860 [Gossypium barbadense]